MLQNAKNMISMNLNIQDSRYDRYFPLPDGKRGHVYVSKHACLQYRDCFSMNPKRETITSAANQISDWFTSAFTDSQMYKESQSILDGQKFDVVEDANSCIFWVQQCQKEKETEYLILAVINEKVLANSEAHSYASA